MSRKDGQGLLCLCGSARLYVKDTRSEAGYVRRRRKCEDCLRTMTTYEVIERTGDPAGAKVGDMMQLREQMMKLTPSVRVAVRQLLARLAGEQSLLATPPPVEVLPPAADNIPEDIPT